MIMMYSREKTPLSSDMWTEEALDVFWTYI